MQVSICEYLLVQGGISQNSSMCIYISAQYSEWKVWMCSLAYVRNEKGALRTKPERGSSDRAKAKLLLCIRMRNSNSDFPANTSLSEPFHSNHSLLIVVLLFYSKWTTGDNLFSNASFWSELLPLPDLEYVKDIEKVHIRYSDSQVYILWENNQLPINAIAL